MALIIDFIIELLFLMMMPNLGAAMHRTRAKNESIYAPIRIVQILNELSEVELHRDFSELHLRTSPKLDEMAGELPLTAGEVPDIGVNITNFLAS